MNDFVVPSWTPGPESAPTGERVAFVARRSLEWRTWEWCRVAQLIGIIYKMALEVASCAIPLEHQVPPHSPVCYNSCRSVINLPDELSFDVCVLCQEQLESHCESVSQQTDN